MAPHLAACWLVAVATLAVAAMSEKDKVWTEVVVSHYSEDLGWLSDYVRPDTTFTVYSKADGAVDVPAAAAKLARLANVGREGHTYLHHIVMNYDRLAPWTVFKQGSGPNQGYVPAESSSGHFNSGVTLDDYIQPFPHGRDATFIMTAAAHFPSGLQLTRPGLAVNGLEQKPFSTRMCPPQWTPWWLEKLHIYTQKFEPSLLEFYDRFVANGNVNSKELMLSFPQGATFAVSRTRIQSRPREYYARLLDQLKMEKDPIQGYWVEASWYDIFHPEALQSERPLCEYPARPERESVASFSNMFNDWVQTMKDHEMFDTSAARKLVAPNAPSSVQGLSSVKPPSSVKAPSSIKSPSSVKSPSSEKAPSSAKPPTSALSGTNGSAMEAFANLTNNEAGTVHSGRISISFEDASQAKSFVQSAEANRILSEVIADANPDLERGWIFIESIEVVLARRLNGNLRDTEMDKGNLHNPSADVRVDYKVFVPRSHTGAGFEAKSMNGEVLVAAINTKAEAAGMNVRVKSATNSVVATEVVGAPVEQLSGSVRILGSAFLAFCAGWIVLA